MLSLLISVLGILLTIFFVIGTHEAAHFAAARLLGVKVLRFSIGFGKTLLRWQDKRGTEYVFALIPLGGYVKMLDEGEGNVAPADRPYAYNRQPFYKRFLIVAAGPLSNLLCAFLLYWIIFMTGFTTIKPIIGSVAPQSIAAQANLPANHEIISIDNKPVLTWSNVLFRLLSHVGNQDKLIMEVKNTRNGDTRTYELNLTGWRMNELTPDPLGSLGIIPYQPNIPLIIGKISKKSPASSVDLQLGDKILSIDHQPVTNWEEFIRFVMAHPGDNITLTIERDKQKIDISVTLSQKRTLTFQKYGYLGVSPEFHWPANFLQKVHFGPIDALPRAWQEMADLTYFNFLLFGKLITGKLSLQSLGGPIMIFESAGDALHSGWLAFIAFLAFLSIAIGIINILPIPGLDGGHLLIQLIELIIRRPLPESVVLNLYRLGLFLLVFVMIQAIINDILRML